MRAIMLLGISLLLAVAIGCVEDAAMSDYAEAPPPTRRAGVSLEPLSIPPPPRVAPVSQTTVATGYATPYPTSSYAPSPDSPYAPLYGGYSYTPPPPAMTPVAVASAPTVTVAPAVTMSAAPQPQYVTGDQPVAYISDAYTLPGPGVNPSTVLSQGSTVTYDSTTFPMVSGPAPVYVDPTYPTTAPMQPISYGGGPVVSTVVGSSTPVAAPVVAVGGVDGAVNAAGYQLVPALDIQPGMRPGDAAPSQWFEVVRPDGGPVRLGRIYSTCVCVSPRISTRYINAGERALIECRIVDRPAVNNVTYGLYVQVLEPFSTTLDSDITVSY